MVKRPPDSALDDASRPGSKLPANEQVRAAPTTPPEGGRWRLLLVDDEPNVLAALRRLLRGEPYDLLAAESGEEGLRLLEQHPVQLVIADERMPGMSGTTFLREVRRRWPGTIRIILSGYSAVKTILAAVNDGAVYKYLTKPWNDDELKISIRRALEQYALEAENRRMAREIAEQNARLKQLNAQLMELNSQLAQHASDATIGLDFVQELLDSVDAGIVTIDTGGLVIGANCRAQELLGVGSLVGLSADEALPQELWSALCAQRPSRNQVRCGRLRVGQRMLEWRARCVEKGDQTSCNRGMVLTIWERGDLC
mgnify:CR=1 FL=1